MTNINDSLNPIPPQEKACRGALKPCPFCGSACQLDQRKSNEWAIACRDVDCPWDIVAWFPTKSEAVTAWNTRHPSLDDPAVVEVVAILENLANPKSSDYVGILPAIKVDAALSALKQRLGEDV
jgi:hypothetical protein